MIKHRVNAIVYFYLIYVGSFRCRVWWWIWLVQVECPVRIQRINDHSLLEKLKSMKTCKFHWFPFKDKWINKVLNVSMSGTPKAESFPFRKKNKATITSIIYCMALERYLICIYLNFLFCNLEILVVYINNTSWGSQKNEVS